MFWTDIARFLQYFRNLSNSFINIFATLQVFNGIFSKYSFNITVLCGPPYTSILVHRGAGGEIFLLYRGMYYVLINDNHVTYQEPEETENFLK